MARFKARKSSWQDESEVTQELEALTVPPPTLHGSGDEVPVFTVIVGRSTGRTFRLDQPRLIIGRAAEAEVAIMDLGISRRHAELVESGGQVWLHDLESMNGTFVNERRLNEPVALTEGDCVRFGANTLLRFGYRNPLEDRLQEQLYNAAIRDPLTRAFNRRYFDECLEAEWAWSSRRGQPCSVIAFDIDHFKQVNDSFGHHAGDQVLREMGRLVALTVRREDTFARVGGEEFAVLVRGTGLPGTVLMAERLRAVVERHRFRVSQGPVQITVSVGVVCSDHPDVLNTELMMTLADRAQYRAKQAGRNCVVEA